MKMNFASDFMSFTKNIILKSWISWIWSLINTKGKKNSFGWIFTRSMIYLSTHLMHRGALTQKKNCDPFVSNLGGIIVQFCINCSRKQEKIKVPRSFCFGQCSLLIIV